MAKKAKKRVTLTESTTTNDPSEKYLLNPRSETFPTGCLMLDCALGGGWGAARIANIVGDRSSGKTLLAIEACANFSHGFPEGNIEYIETEAAFDKTYAESLGLPLNRINFPVEVFTVEDLHKTLEQIIADADGPTLVIVDSLDALSDNAELDRDIGEASYGANKAKMLSQMFRRINQRLAGKHIAVIVVSQVRENMNAGAFGRKWTRSGGKALDFYCTQILHLQHTGRLTRTSKGVKRVVGVKVKVKVEKNKIGPPFREVEFPIYFGYGIEDLEASLSWLLEVKEYDGIADSLEGLKKLLKRVKSLSSQEYRDLQARAKKLVIETWATIEADFEVVRSKYGDTE